MACEDNKIIKSRFGIRHEREGWIYELSEPSNGIHIPWDPSLRDQTLKERVCAPTPRTFRVLNSPEQLRDPHTAALLTSQMSHICVQVKTCSGGGYTV